MGIKVNVPLPSKGLVVDRPAEFVDTRSASEIKNMEVNRNIIRKRFGTTSVGDSLGERTQRLFELQVGNATRLFRVGPTMIEALNKSTEAWASVAHAALTGSDDDNVSYAFPLLSGEKIVTYTNGIDDIRKCSITGNDAVLGGSPPKARFNIAFGPYLVLAYIFNGPNVLYSGVQWSDTGDPETWSGGNAGSTNLLDDPDDITGLGVFGNSLTVHKANSIYVGQLVTTSDVFRFDRKATGVGAVSEATIQNIPSGEQIFLASDGLHIFNGITAPLVEAPIQDELREEMNPAYLFKAQSVFVEELDEYWVAVPIGSQTEPLTVYKYNWRTGQIYKDYRPGLTAMGLFLNTTELTWADMTLPWSASTARWGSVSLSGLNPVVMFGDEDGVSTKRTATSQDDNGVAVESVFETKDFTSQDFGLPDMDVLMRWKGMEVWAKGSEMSVYYSTDGGSSWTLITALTLSSDYPDDDAPLNVYFDLVKSRVRFRFYNDGLAENFSLKKYQLEATPREARK